MVHPQWRARRGAAGGTPRSRPAVAVGARPHATPVCALGERPYRRLVDQSAAFLRGAVPGVVQARRQRDAGLRAPTGARRGGPAGGAVFGRAPWVQGGAARRTGRLHRRPRRDGHLGHIVAVAADRRRVGAGSGPVRPGVPHGPAAAGSRDHPDLAVRDGRAFAGRTRHASVAHGGDLGLDRGRRQTRSSPNQRGTRPRGRTTYSTSTVRTLCATGRPAAGPAWTWSSTRVR